MKTVITSKHHKTFSIEFVKDYLITMRPYLLFVSGVTGICGMSFVDELPISKSILIFLASFLSYGFGQALTDVFQTDTDSISSPYRPLTQGIVSKSQVFSISIIGLILCISIFSIYNPINLLLGIVSGLGLATYTYFKRKFWAGPFYNAWIVGVLFLMAFLCGSELELITGNHKLVYSLSAVYWGYANFVLVGYFKDVEADRETGYNTFLVVFGRRMSSIASNIFGVLTVISTISVFTYSNSLDKLLEQLPYATIILAIGIVAMFLCQAFVHLIKNDDGSSKAISLSVHAYILLLTSIIVSNKGEWIIPMIIFYVFFNLTMIFRPAKNQI
ncbi:MAG: UbiA family prenyltransferase [Ignavibacteriaceae bacterium]|nr:UbiA family prenyltransferase [Ignavibacteriaceae bacterium]